jgi:hypothetical protein
MQLRGLEYDMVLSELADAVGEEHVSTRASDKPVYATDWSGCRKCGSIAARATSPDFIVHPGSPRKSPVCCKSPTLIVCQW